MDLSDDTIDLARIRAYAQHKRWGKHRLAREAHLHPNTLRDFDNPKWNPRLETLLKLKRLVPDEFDAEAANLQAEDSTKPTAHRAA